MSTPRRAPAVRPATARECSRPLRPPRPSHPSPPPRRPVHPTGSRRAERGSGAPSGKAAARVLPRRRPAPCSSCCCCRRLERRGRRRGARRQQQGGAGNAGQERPWGRSHCHYHCSPWGSGRTCVGCVCGGMGEGGGRGVAEAGRGREEVSAGRGLAGREGRSEGGGRGGGVGGAAGAGRLMRRAVVAWP